MQRLRELGWIEGRTVAIEYRWADGRSERFADIAAEMVRLKVDVIVTSGLAVPAAQQATSVIPIVFALASDPVGTGMVASLARPGGNVTGLSLQSGIGRQAARAAARGSARSAPAGVHGQCRQSFTDARTGRASNGGPRAWPRDGILAIRRAADIGHLRGVQGAGAGAHVVGSDPLVTANRIAISTLAAAARLPTMHSGREFVEAGGLLSYGPSFADLFRRTGNYVDKILRGAKPADMPVEQPTKFDLVINLTTAKALGLTIPESFLLRADEVIE